MEIDND